MHETRNLILIILLVLCVLWGFAVWFVVAGFGESATTGVWIQRYASLGLIAILGAWCWYALNVEDKLPDRLAGAVGTKLYFDVDGLSFMPTIRVRDGQAELCVYYQNRFENYAQAVVHLRPPEDGFIIRPGVRDLHFTFKADGGDYGVLHQPIGVPRHLQGDVLHVQVAAAVRFPRSHGDRLISSDGLPCGTFPVDWMSAFKVGVHEVSGEIKLSTPASLHLSLPDNVHEGIKASPTWKQELIEPGPSVSAVMA